MPKAKQDIHTLRDEYETTLEMVAKLNNWKANYNKLDDYYLKKSLVDVINNRLKEMYKRIDELEKILDGK